MHNGQNILVTGASGGIGKATALLAAERGCHVAVHYHKQSERAQAVVQEISEAGGKAKALQANLAIESEVVALFEQFDEHFGVLHALVNNAGILKQQMPLEQMDAERIQAVLACNDTGVFLCCREGVKRMAVRHGGTGGGIVNVSSVAAKLGSPFEYIDYAASKAAVDALTIGLAKEVATDGIRVNAVRPGIIDTQIHALGGEPNRIERVRHSVPMLRAGQAEEVAESILWLLSSQASYTTGSLLDVSGGR